MSMSNWSTERICTDPQEVHRIAMSLKERFNPKIVPLMVFYDATKHLYKTQSRYNDCNPIDINEPKLGY